MNVLIFKKKAKGMTKDQSRDTGMAMVLLLLLFYIRTRRDGFLWWAFLLHVLNMMVPKIYAPIAVLWLGFSHVLGTVMSKIADHLVLWSDHTDWHTAAAFRQGFVEIAQF